MGNNRGSFAGGKAGGREADHSPPSSAEVKEWVELYLHFMAWCLFKHKDNFTFYFYPPNTSLYAMSVDWRW
jgi:hypothetical protein